MLESGMTWLPPLSKSLCIVIVMYHILHLGSQEGLSILSMQGFEMPCVNARKWLPKCWLQGVVGRSCGAWSRMKKHWHTRGHCIVGTASFFYLLTWSFRILKSNSNTRSSEMSYCVFVMSNVMTAHTMQVKYGSFSCPSTRLLSSVLHATHNGRYAAVFPNVWRPNIKNLWHLKTSLLW